MPRNPKAEKRIAVLGYGSQGRAIALNLRDSGFDVVIGLRERSKSRRLARKDGFALIAGFSDAAEQADVVIFAFPDHLHGRLYASQISRTLRPKTTLVFLHGTSIHFDFVKPPGDCDVILLAPHAPGLAVREKFLGDGSVSAFYAVHQNHSKKALATIFTLARGIGIRKSRLIKTTFAHESLGDLFGEQAVLCGGMAALIHAGFKTLCKHGIKPDHAYLEVAYQLDLIISLVKRFGIEGMLRRISVAARFGSILTGPRIIDAATRKRMELVYKEIVSGRFPEKLDKLTDADIKKIDKALAKLSSPAFERSARKFSA